jgi:competence protein ComEC
VIPRPLGYAPLLPFAVAATAGIVADRYLGIESSHWLIVVAAGLVVAVGGGSFLGPLTRGRSPGSNDLLRLAGLWLSAGGIAGAYHHGYRNDFAADDIGNVAAVEPRLVRLRGTLAEEPSIRRPVAADPLIARPRTDFTTTTLDVSAIDAGGTWTAASGKVRVSIEGAVTDVHVADEVEVIGWLARPHGPMNPGERDFPSRLQDERIRAELRVLHSPDGVVRLHGGSWGVRRTLADVRGSGQRALAGSLPSSEAPVASALLLGDTHAMTAAEWDRYVRTGVIHVLAISGQHLVILGAFLWFVLRVFGVRRRSAAIIVAAVLVAYALMTGGRPSAMRAAVMACAYCLGILMRTRPLPANTFALAWLVVLAFNPTDLFTAGFQLSFLCVAVLFWGIPRWFPPRELTPEEQIKEESRPLVVRSLRDMLRLIGRAYLVTLFLGVATAPLIAYWQNLISPAGIVIGPPAILLTTVALISGFLLLILWPLGPVALPLAWIATQSIWLCEGLVSAADLPLGCWYVGALPMWWVVGFYLIGGVWLLSGGPEHTRVIPDFGRPRHFAIVLAAWAIIGLVASTARSVPDEMRVTFLAVDHGGCAVIETPDGRVLLYDAGANAGPDVAKRQIAPFLWHRGIRRIDEVFLSHADLDHFNGLPVLLDRFAVGQITYTPSFSEKPTPAVKAALEAIARRGTPLRVARAGDRFSTGELEIDVLHPPADGPPGVENVRSMVLLLRHRGHSILLTGDLERAGVDLVTAGPAPLVDVLMTPHHGAGGGRVEILADWSRPRLAIASQGRGDAGKAEAIYRKKGVAYWSTWPDGAITLRSHASGLTAETFVTGKREVVRAGKGP